MGQVHGTVTSQGHDSGEIPLSNKDGIDELTGTVNVYTLLPERGDSITITNCGTHYEVRHQHVTLGSGIYLTDQDIEDLKQGRIVWN